MCWGGPASYNGAIVLGLFSGGTSLSWGQQPQSHSLSLLPSPPERPAWGHLGKVQNEICSHVQEMLEDPPSSGNVQTPAQGGPSPTSNKDRLCVSVTAESLALTQGRAGKVPAEGMRAGVRA